MLKLTSARSKRLHLNEDLALTVAERHRFDICEQVGPVVGLSVRRSFHELRTLWGRTCVAIFRQELGEVVD